MQLPLVPNDKYRNWGVQEGVFTKEECEKVVRLFDKLPKEKGGIHAGSKEPERRDSMIAWLRYGGEGDWIYKRLWERLQKINETHYRYDLVHIQSLQLTQYVEAGHYIWHADMSWGKNSVRKLSCTVQLTDPAEYEGGDLILRTHVDEKAPRTQGALVFFPSFIVHCVEPVTKGTRHSMVSWVAGPPFR